MVRETVANETPVIFEISAIVIFAISFSAHNLKLYAGSPPETRSAAWLPQDQQLAKLLENGASGIYIKNVG
jgi:hypothetical protein